MTRPSTISAAFGVPTAQDIERWQEESDRINEQIKGLESQREAYLSLIRGAQVLLNTPAQFAPAPLVSEFPRNVFEYGDPPKKRGRPPGKTIVSWPTALLAILNAHQHGITYADLRKAHENSAAGKKLGNSEKSLYGAIGKLVNREQAVRYKGHAFTREHYDKFMADLAAGRVQDIEESSATGQKSPFGDAIKAHIEAKRGGWSSAEIAAQLKTVPEFADTMEKHKSHLYNVLARLVEQGVLVKGGGKYFRAPSTLKVGE